MQMLVIVTMVTKSDVTKQGKAVPKLAKEKSGRLKYARSAGKHSKIIINSQNTCESIQGKNLTNAVRVTKRFGQK